jgi:nucleotide-binding universal stress UspA family protein
MADTIVVGYDGSDQSKKALDAAVAHARLLEDAEIVIVCAQDRPGPAIGFRGAEFGVEEMWDKVARQIEEELAQAATQVEKAGVKVAVACTPDRPDISIMKVAADTDARLIVLGVKGAGARPGQKTHLGSTTNKVLHEAGGIPVLVV